jgi:CO/xanthine dehydrogenase Mo-binding subunit
VARVAAASALEARAAVTAAAVRAGEARARAACERTQRKTAQYLHELGRVRRGTVHTLMEEEVAGRKVQPRSGPPRHEAHGRGCSAEKCSLPSTFDHGNSASPAE